MAAVLNYLGYGSGMPSPPPESDHTTRALPSSWYTTQEIYDLERRAIFSKRWLLTTHKLRLKVPGDWLRYDIAGFDVVIAKDRKGSIHAFHNVCRHRAYPVVEKDQGSSKIFACRYHGWSYGLDGKFAKAPGYQDIQGFDKSANNLFPIHVHIDHNGFVWINMDGQAKPEISWTQDFDGVDLNPRVSQYNFEDYEFDHAWQIDAAYNWKLAADNYNECYHCKTTHPDIPALANLESYEVKTIGAHIDHNAATTKEQKAQGMSVTATYYFPNASMNVMPQFFFVQRFTPKGPTSTTICYEVFRSKYASDEQFEQVDKMYKRVMTEDKVLCTAQQRNLGAGVFVNGELHPKMETGPLYFQKLVREALTSHHRQEQAARREITPARQQIPFNAKLSSQDVEFCSGLACSPQQQEGLAW